MSKDNLGGDSNTTGVSGDNWRVVAFMRHSDGGKDRSHITKKEGQVAIQLGKVLVTALFPLKLELINLWIQGLSAGESNVGDISTFVY